MDFKQMHYIVKIAETGNITRAAEELYISQPSLSHFLSKTEQELGVKLFHRNTGALTLTEAGESYLRTARQILSLSHNLKEELSDISHLKHRRIVLGMPPARTAAALPHIVPVFREKYPGVQLVTYERSSDILLDAVRNGTVDFAILPADKLEPDLEGETLFEEEIFLAARRDTLPPDAVTHGSCVDFERLGAHPPFVLLKSNHGIRKTVDTLFYQYGIHPDIVMETSSNDAALRLAATGIGAAIVPAVTLYTMAVPSSMAFYHLSAHGMKWPVAMIHRQNEYLTQLKLEIADLLQAGFEKENALLAERLQ